MRTLVLALALVVTSGCVCDAVKNQAKVTAAANDGYVRLATEGIANLTTADLAGLTVKTRALINNLSKAVGKNRRAWHKTSYALNGAPLPADLETYPQIEAPGPLGD